MKNNLHKVLIVDDEYLIRELLEQAVNWENIGCEVVGKASCPAEVYDFLDENLVDIIITDINMPVVDGVTMSRVIKQQYSKIKIIILTGYDEFEYAKKSIKIGIDDYILKPINEAEIEASILRVIEKIHSEEKQAYEFESLKERLRQNMPYLKEKFFLELLQNSLTIHDILERGQFFGLEFQSEFFQVALVQLILPAEQSLTEEERQLLLFRIKNMIEQNFSNIENIQILFDGQERIVIIDCDHQVNRLEELNYLLKIIKQNIQWDIGMGIGGVKKSIEDMRISYQEALNALQYKTILGNNLVIHFDDIGMITETHSDFPSIDESELNELQFLIKAGLKDNAISYVEELYNKMSVYGQRDEKNYIGHMRVQTTRVISVLYYMISSMNIKLLEITNEKDCFDNIYTLRTIPDAKEHVVQFVSKIVNYINDIQKHKVNDFIEDIEKYIIERIGDHGLTLKGTADHFYINPSYLSRVYKQKKGISFKEYVNKIRMEKAMELLRNTDLKVYVIGEQVGIPDPNYFSSCFKKFMDMSVSEYKKSILTE